MTGANPEEAKVWVGRHVELELRYTDGEEERLSLDVVADESADFAAGFLGESTPLAKAIIGLAAGSRVTYQAGDTVEVRILSVSSQLRAEPRDLSERREAVTRKAIQQSDQASLTIYATSMNSKWGSYDPEVLQDDSEEQDAAEPHSADQSSAEEG